MNPEILIRLGLVLIFGVLGFGFFRIMNTRFLARMREKMKQPPNFQPGQFSILYFTSPTCAPCQFIQRPALQQVREKLGDRLQVIEVDASAKPDLAKEWNILSVPTTFLIDAQGIARFVNHGATRAEKLLEQINKL